MQQNKANKGGEISRIIQSIRSVGSNYFALTLGNGEEMVFHGDLPVMHVIDIVIRKINPGSSMQPEGPDWKVPRKKHYHFI